MRISIAMKSNFAFDRLKTTFAKKEAYQGVHTYEKNIQTHEGVVDLIEYWQPDLFVLDSKLPEIAVMSTTIEENEIPIVYFESDFDSVLEQIESIINGEKESSQEQGVEKKQITYVKDERPKEIVYQDRIVEKEVIRTSYTSVPNKLVVIGSLWQGAGSTTLAMNLARAISERGLKVSYVEYPTLNPYVFDYLDIPSKEDELNTVYVDFAREISSKGSVKRKESYWNELGINWYVLDSRNEPIDSFSYDEMLKFVYSLNSTITIVDVSANFHKEDVQSFLNHADEIIVCVEPDPVKIDRLYTIKNQQNDSEKQRNEKRVMDYLDKIEETEGVSYQFVTMKFSSKVDKKVWVENFPTKQPLTYLPYFNYEDWIDCVWNSKTLYDNEEYNTIFEKALKPIIVRVLPREFYEIKDDSNSNKNKLRNIFKRRVTK